MHLISTLINRKKRSALLHPTLKIAIIVGSTRPGRRAPLLAQWLLDSTNKRTDATFEIVDIQDYDLPVLDEPACVKTRARQGRLEIDSARRSFQARKFLGGLFVAVI